MRITCTRIRCFGFFCTLPGIKIAPNVKLIGIVNIEKRFSGVSGTIFFLMVIGTGYDIYITRKYTHGRNVIYDLERHVKLEQLAVKNQKSLSGKIFNL